MLETNYPFLESDLLDVVRMFKTQCQEIKHAMSYDGSVFCNSFTVEGERFSFQNEKATADEVLYKRYARRFAKLALYRILSKKYNEQMPWGALTGIRPTKFAYTEQEETGEYIQSLKDMFVTEENIRLVEQVLENQKGIYAKEDGNSDLFVSIPFCPTKCEYCSFITAPVAKTKQFMEGYLTSLEKEIASSPSVIKNLRSVYIGGGTPLVLEENELERVLKAVDKVRKNDCEYTVEAGRPDVFTEEKLKLLKDYGVTRICINSQSFIDSTLVKIGRKHTANDVYRAFEMSEKYHFSVNCDLIAGLADENTEDFKYSVEQAVKCNPDNVTVHTLCLKKGAKLKEECTYLDTEGISDMILSSRKILSESGYVPYYMYRQKYMAGNCENTGWTKKGKACVYNIDIMEETADNPACGANAVSKRVFNKENRLERYGSPKDLKTYIEKVDEIILQKQKLFE